MSRYKSNERIDVNWDSNRQCWLVIEQTPDGFKTWHDSIHTEETAIAMATEIANDECLPVYVEGRLREPKETMTTRYAIYRRNEFHQHMCSLSLQVEARADTLGEAIQKAKELAATTAPMKSASMFLPAVFCVDREEYSHRCYVTPRVYVTNV